MTGLKQSILLMGCLVPGQCLTLRPLGMDNTSQGVTATAQGTVYLLEAPALSTSESLQPSTTLVRLAVWVIGGRLHPEAQAGTPTTYETAGLTQ